MIEEKLKILKKEYIRDSMPVYLLENGWWETKSKLAEPEISFFHLFVARGLIFASVGFISMFGGLTTAAQAAKPGSILYTLKILTEEIAIKITGREDIRVERRAQEVIDLADDGEKLDKALMVYEETLEEAKEDVDNSESSHKFKEVLEKQEQKFKDAVKNNPSAGAKLDEAIKKTEEAKGEVRGRKDEKGPDDNKSDNPKSKKNNQNQNQGNQGQSNESNGSNNKKK